MWIKSDLGEWIDGDKICCFYSSDWNDGTSTLYADCANRDRHSIVKDNMEKVEYIKEQLIKRLIEGWDTFDVSGMLDTFQREGRYRRV